MQLVLLCIALAVGAWALAHGWRILAQRTRLLAHPNARSAHTSPTPTAAGVAFLLPFFLVLLWPAATPDEKLVWLGPLLVAVIGFIDDLRPLPVVVRAPGYALGSAWSIAFVGFPLLDIGGNTIDLGAFGLVFGFLSLLWLQNLYNFMDGIDGIAVFEAIFVIAAAWLIGGGPVDPATPLLLAAACTGFAVINWPPAKVFMGDVGASFLGLSLGIFALQQVWVSVWVWMILLGWFVTDACLTILVRLARGERIHESHNLHAYQHLTRRFGAPATLYVVVAVNALWLAPMAALAARFQDMAVFLLISAYVPLLVAQFIAGAGQQQPIIDISRGRRKTAD